MNKINLLLIGFGPHAKRIYYPFCRQKEKLLGFKLAYGVDLLNKKEEIEDYLKRKGDCLPMYYVTDNNKKSNILERDVMNSLNKIVDDYSIRGVIISTEPLSHVKYAAWALSKGLHILMDKPISACVGASVSETAALKINKDFKYLKKIYKKSKAKYGRVIFNLMAQRRYHPAFIKIRNLIREVFKKTNSPITSIQSFHSDGQWRLPSEIIDINYHSYNDGFGKCSHSGYHSLDIMPWLIETAESKSKHINNVDIYSSFLRPNDFISQINLNDYKKIFHHFLKRNKYNEKTFRVITKKYGELDAFSQFSFKHNNDIITLGSLNLVHNGFSQRGWLEAKKDLYKGNGRVRHETHFIEQGPFQAISFISYQSEEINPKNKTRIYDVGGEYHLDVHVFRNASLFPEWKRYTKFGTEDLNVSVTKEYSRGHQEDARREAIIEYINLIKGKIKISTSDFISHERGTKLLSGVYMSATKKFIGKNPVVNVKF